MFSTLFQMIPPVETAISRGGMLGKVKSQGLGVFLCWEISSRVEICEASSCKMLIRLA